MDKDLIVIILAAAFWILSALINNNKKKAAARQRQNPTPADSGYLREATEHSTAGDSYEARSAEIYSEAEPWSYDSQVVDEVTRQRLLNVSAEHMGNKRQPETKSDKHKRNIEGTKDMEVLTSDPQELGVIRGFNLRDAIIYSELLRPKFEE